MMTGQNSIAASQAEIGARFSGGASCRKNITKYVEDGDWDERLLRNQSRFDGFCLGVLLAAVLFFLPLCAGIMLP